MLKPYEIVSDVATETHKAIKAVNKWPEKSRQEKDAKQDEIDRLKNQWWEDCKGLFK